MSGGAVSGSDDSVGSGVDELDADGHTPLFVACTLGGEVISVEHLLDSRADPNFATETSRSTPLHAACDRGHELLVAALLSAGARHDMRDAHGLTPLERAQQQRHEECVAVIDTHCKLEEHSALRELRDAYALEKQEHEAAYRELAESEREHVEALAELEARHLAMAGSFKAVETSLRAELASVSAKLAHAQEWIASATGTELEEEPSSRESKQNLRAQLNAETRARAAVADMLSDRHRAYDALAVKYKELRSAHRQQMEANAELTAELLAAQDSAASTGEQLLAEQSQSGAELTFVQLECEQLRQELAETSATSEELDSTLVKQAEQIAQLEEEVRSLLEERKQQEVMERQQELLKRAEDGRLEALAARGRTVEVEQQGRPSDDSLDDVHARAGAAAELAESVLARYSVSSSRAASAAKIQGNGAAATTAAAGISGSDRTGTEAGAGSGGCGEGLPPPALSSRAVAERAVFHHGDGGASSGGVGGDSRGSDDLADLRWRVRSRYDDWPIAHRSIVQQEAQRLGEQQRSSMAASAWAEQQQRGQGQGQGQEAQPPEQPVPESIAGGGRFIDEEVAGRHAVARLTSRYARQSSASVSISAWAELPPGHGPTESAVRTASSSSTRIIEQIRRQREDRAAKHQLQQLQQHGGTRPAVAATAAYR
jgi:hypothetical protein